MGGERAAVTVVGADLSLEAEIGILEEDAGVDKAGTADGELVEGGPAAGRVGGGGEEVGDGGRDGGEAFVLPADVANQGGELGADAGESGPVARVVLELAEYFQHHVVGELREHGFFHFLARPYVFLGRFCGNWLENSAGWFQAFKFVLMAVSETRFKGVLDR